MKWPANHAGERDLDRYAHNIRSPPSIVNAASPCVSTTGVEAGLKAKSGSRAGLRGQMCLTRPAAVALLFRIRNIIRIIAMKGIRLAAIRIGSKE